MMDATSTSVGSASPLDGFKVVPREEQQYAAQALNRMEAQVDRLRCSNHWPECEDDLREMMACIDRCRSKVQAQSIRNREHSRRAEAYDETRA